MARYVVVDGCPVPRKLAEEVREVKRLSGATLVSCYRGQDAEALLRKHGKQSQRQLYDGWVRRRPGYNPANPPGRSTHELRNDGVAYRGPVGMRLRYWQVGMDWSDAGAVVRAARKRRFTATVTYPGNPREGHHVNFRREPRFNVFRPLKKGSKGPRVRSMSARLAYLGYLPGVSPRTGAGGFGPRVEAALKRFQRAHHQTADGIYGVRSHRQLIASVAAKKRRRRKEVAAKRKAKARAATGLSAKGVAFIADFEGFSAVPYNDPSPGRHCTVGYGHLIHRGPCTAADRRKWGAISQARGRELLKRDAAAAAAAVAKQVKVPLNQHQRDALIDWVYNVGTGAFAGSTLLRKLNAGDYRSVPSELARWTKSGGQEVPGLVRRRKAEGQLFARGIY